MATYTPNLNLYKPDASDPFGEFREKFNDNMDILDNGGGGGSGGHTIYDENGSAMTQRAGLEFTGSVSVSDDSVNDKTIVDVKGGTSFLLNTIYSETEKRVGYWKDNKPLYQKTVHIANLPNGSPNDWVFYNVGLSNLETVANAHGIIHFANGYQAPLPYVVANPYVETAQVGMTINASGEIGIMVNTDRSTASAYITIQYTKTTDTAETPELGNVIYMPTIYSDTERQIGVWRDNKPLYQKTFHTNTPSTAQTIAVIANITDLNIDEVAVLFGSVTNSSNCPVNWYLDNSNRTACFVNLAKTGIAMWIENSAIANIPCNVTIQYTKTTDTAGSGDWTTDGTPTVHYSTNEKVIGTWVDGKPVYERLIDLNGFSIDRDTWYSTNIPLSNYNIKGFVEQGSLYQEYNGFIQVFPCALGIMASTYIGVDVKWDGGSTTRAFKYLKIRYTKTTD